MEANPKCHRIDCNEQRRSDSAFCSEECKNLFWGPEYLQKKLSKKWSLKEMQTQLLEWGKNSKSRNRNHPRITTTDDQITLAENLFFQHQSV